MYDKHNKQLTFIVYDSILNSVFESQVLTPLLQMLEESSNVEITLISFERALLSKRNIMRTFSAHDRLHLILCKRLPFFGRFSLKVAAWQLRRILQNIPSHGIIARGALAGWIAYRALNRMAQKTPGRMRTEHPQPLPSLTLQARGLCAEELRFRHEHHKQNFIRRLLFNFLYKQLKQIECEIYRTKQKTDYPNDVAIEAVSPALHDYLVDHFHADPAKIILATKDFPTPVFEEQRKEWREEVRTALKIDNDIYVYGYSGSAQPWQCIPEMLFYFLEKVKENHKSFWLILTNEPKTFRRYCSITYIPEKHYRILNVHPKDVFKYLSACDAGLLFRKKDVINFVARPTKMLEYKAVGLKIIHNNTIAWLTKKEKKGEALKFFIPATSSWKK